MKRTKLGRGKTTLGRQRRNLVTVEEQFAKDQWRTWAATKPCAVCSTDQRVEGHHAIYAQHLRFEGLEDQMWTRSNCLPLCRRCHANHHSAFRRVRWDELHPLNVAFARSMMLLPLLERLYPTGPVDPTWKEAARWATSFDCAGRS